MKTLNEATPSDIIEALGIVAELAQGFQERRPDHAPWIEPALGWLQFMKELASADLH